MISVGELKLGQKFRIPFPGGYAHCCVNGKNAVYEAVQRKQWLSAPQFSMKCVECNKETAFEDTFIQIVELVEAKNGH